MARKKEAEGQPNPREFRDRGQAENFVRNILIPQLEKQGMLEYVTFADIKQSLAEEGIVLTGDSMKFFQGAFDQARAEVSPVESVPEVSVLSAGSEGLPAEEKQKLLTAEQHQDLLDRIAIQKERFRKIYQDSSPVTWKTYEGSFNHMLAQLNSAIDSDNKQLLDIYIKDLVDLENMTLDEEDLSHDVSPREGGSVVDNDSDDEIPLTDGSDVKVLDQEAPSLPGVHWVTRKSKLRDAKKMPEVADVRTPDQVIEDFVQSSGLKIEPDEREKLVRRYNVLLQKSDSSEDKNLSVEIMNRQLERYLEGDESRELTGAELLKQFDSIWEKLKLPNVHTFVDIKSCEDKNISLRDLKDRLTLLNDLAGDIKNKDREFTIVFGPVAVNKVNESYWVNILDPDWEEKINVLLGQASGVEATDSAVDVSTLPEAYDLDADETILVPPPAPGSFLDSALDLPSKPDFVDPFDDDYEFLKGKGTQSSNGSDSSVRPAEEVVTTSESVHHEYTADYVSDEPSAKSVETASTLRPDEILTDDTGEYSDDGRGSGSPVDIEVPVGDTATAKEPEKPKELNPKEVKKYVKQAIKKLGDERLKIHSKADFNIATALDIDNRLGQLRSFLDSQNYQGDVLVSGKNVRSIDSEGNLSVNLDMSVANWQQSLLDDIAEKNKQKTKAEIIEILEKDKLISIDDTFSFEKLTVEKVKEMIRDVHNVVNSTHPKYTGKIIFSSYPQSDYRKNLMQIDPRVDDWRDSLEKSLDRQKNFDWVREMVQKSDKLSIAEDFVIDDYKFYIAKDNIESLLELLKDPRFNFDFGVMISNRIYNDDIISEYKKIIYKIGRRKNQKYFENDYDGKKPDDRKDTGVGQLLRNEVSDRFLSADRNRDVYGRLGSFAEREGDDSLDLSLSMVTDRQAEAEPQDWLPLIPKTFDNIDASKVSIVAQRGQMSIYSRGLEDMLSNEPDKKEKAFLPLPETPNQIAAFRQVLRSMVAFDKADEVRRALVERFSRDQKDNRVAWERAGVPKQWLDNIVIGKEKTNYDELVAGKQAEVDDLRLAGRLRAEKFSKTKQPGFEPSAKNSLLPEALIKAGEKAYKEKNPWYKRLKNWVGASFGERESLYEKDVAVREVKAMPSKQRIEEGITKREEEWKIEEERKREEEERKREEERKFNENIGLAWSAKEPLLNEDETLQEVKNLTEDARLFVYPGVNFNKGNSDIIKTRIKQIVRLCDSSDYQGKVGLGGRDLHTMVNKGHVQLNIESDDWQAKLNEKIVEVKRMEEIKNFFDSTDQRLKTYSDITYKAESLEIIKSRVPDLIAMLDKAGFTGEVYLMDTGLTNKDTRAEKRIRLNIVSATWQDDLRPLLTA